MPNGEVIKSKLYDVCVLYWNGRSFYHKSTIHYNKKFPIAKWLSQEEMKKPTYPKGTVVIPVPNGIKPLDYLKMKREK